MKLRNPKYVSPAVAWAKANAAALNTWLADNAANEYLEFDALRAAFPALAGYADGDIEAVCVEFGVTVAQ